MQNSTNSSSVAGKAGVDAMPGSEPYVSMKPAAKPNNTVPAAILNERRAACARSAGVASSARSDSGDFGASAPCGARAVDAAPAA